MDKCTVRNHFHQSIPDTTANLGTFTTGTIMAQDSRPFSPHDEFFQIECTIGVESNWNSFEIRSIRFENLRFDWFEKAKKVWKIRKFSIRNSFDSKENNSKNSQIFQILFSDSKNSKFFPSQKTFWAIQFWVMALRGYCIENTSSTIMFTYISFVAD